MVPTFGPPPLPFTVQFTPVLVDPVTVAVNCTDFAGASVAEAGVMDTATVDATAACTIAGIPTRDRTKVNERIEVDRYLWMCGIRGLIGSWNERGYGNRAISAQYCAISTENL